MIYTVYDAASGVITGTMTITLPNTIGSGISYIPGAYDAERYYIKDQKPELYPAQPSSNTWVVWSWDITTETWNINTSISARNVRGIRDAKLVAVDRVNPFWYNSMSESERAQVEAYRLALLNVPEQAGFPVDITWPIKPSWL
jgi:hypothetical protein